MKVNKGTLIKKERALIKSEEVKTMETMKYLKQLKAEDKDYVQLYKVEVGTRLDANDPEYNAYEAYGKKGLYDCNYQVCTDADIECTLDYFSENRDENSYLYVIDLGLEDLDNVTETHKMEELNMYGVEILVHPADVMLKVNGTDEVVWPLVHK